VSRIFTPRLDIFLMATKLKVVLRRAEAKDYRDIAAMIKAGVNLSYVVVTA
jgi:hypothetical protein